MKTRLDRTLLVPLLLLAAMTMCPASRPAQQSQPPSGQGASAEQQPTLPPPASDKVDLYFYRPRRFESGANKPSIYLDNQEVARMVNGRFFMVRVAPGHHTIRSNDKMSGVEADFKAGQQYFIRVDMVTAFWNNHGRITMLAPEQGLYEVRQTKLLDVSDVKNAELVFLPAPQTAGPK